MTSVLGLTTLAVLVLFDVTTPAGANVISAMVCIGPSFALNRRWVWKGAGCHWRREVMPFWGYALLSLVLSTVAVAIAGHWADSIGALAEERTMIILGANMLASGTRWIGQFLLLDKVLFRHDDTSYVVAPAGGA